MKPFDKRMLFILMAVSLLSVVGCVPAATPQPEVNQTAVAEQVNAARTEAVETAMAGLAQTQAALPTATELPTQEPTATEIPATATALPLPTLVPPTATLIPTIAYPTWTPTPAPYQCQITAQDPKIGAYFSPKPDFDARWTIKNTGTKTWEATEVDYFHLSGKEMYKADSRYDLKKDVKPGEEITIIVDMTGPSETGNYTETWALGTSSGNFCPMSITININ